MRKAETLPEVEAELAQRVAALTKASGPRAWESASDRFCLSSPGARTWVERVGRVMGWGQEAAAHCMAPGSTLSCLCQMGE